MAARSVRGSALLQLLTLGEALPCCKFPCCCCVLLVAADWQHGVKVDILALLALL
jgi:hypothetical protein